MSKKRIALIFGITGQDGSYLAEFLLKKKYIVHGVKRRSSSINTSRVDHIYQEPGEKSRNFFLHYGDITDSTSVSKIIELVKPHKKNIGLLKLLKKKNYAYHFAYKVRNLEKTLFRLKKNFKVIVNPVPAKAFNDKKVAFLKMKNDFIIELIQS